MHNNEIDLHMQIIQLHTFKCQTGRENRKKNEEAMDGKRA